MRVSERGWEVTRRVVAAVVVIAAFAVTPSVAAAAMSWTGPVEIDHTGGISAQAVSCPSSSECVAVGRAGQEVMFNPTSAEAQVRSVLESNGLVAVSCPATTQCTAIDGGGSEVTFDPALPDQPPGSSRTAPRRSLAGLPSAGLAPSAACRVRRSASARRSARPGRR